MATKTADEAEREDLDLDELELLQADRLIDLLERFRMALKRTGRENGVTWHLCLALEGDLFDSLMSESLHETRDLITRYRDREDGFLEEIETDFARATGVKPPSERPKPE